MHARAQCASPWGTGSFCAIIVQVAASHCHSALQRRAWSPVAVWVLTSVNGALAGPLRSAHLAGEDGFIRRPTSHSA